MLENQISETTLLQCLYDNVRAKKPVARSNDWRHSAPHAATRAFFREGQVVTAVVRRVDEGTAYLSVNGTGSATVSAKACAKEGAVAYGDLAVGQKVRGRVKAWYPKTRQLVFAGIEGIVSAATAEKDPGSVGAGRQPKPVYATLPAGTAVLVDGANVLHAFKPTEASQVLRSLVDGLKAQGYEARIFLEHRAWKFLACNQASEAAGEAFMALCRELDVTFVGREADLAILQSLKAVPNSVGLTNDRYADDPEGAFALMGLFLYNMPSHMKRNVQYVGRAVVSRALALSLLLSATAAICFAAEVRCERSEPPAASVGAVARRVVRDIAYAPENGKSGLGDLYLPENANADTPVVLAIHGGGWSAGDRESWRGVAEFFRDELGFAAFNIEYRLASPANRWPACGDDCVGAARWLLSSAFERVAGFRPKKIWICGGSAGGHLALWTLVNLRSDEVAGAVAISPIGDPAPDVAVHGGRYRALLGGAADLSALDPRAHFKPGMAPLLMTHATGDQVVPIRSSRNFEKAYSAAGNRVEFFEYPENLEANQGGHCIWRPHATPHRLLGALERRIADFVREVSASASKSMKN